MKRSKYSGNDVGEYPVTIAEKVVVPSKQKLLSEVLAELEEGGGGGGGSDIDTVEVTVDSSTGTPSGTGSVSGSTLSLSFHNLKGETGLQGIQGPQGNPGSSIDYPFELENSLTSTDTTKALTAAMGKELNDKIAEGSLPTTDIENADLEFQDGEGNVLVRFANGHIQTKNFDSSEGSGGGGASRSLKILFFGNSLTQDAIAYLPLLLNEIAPNLDYTIYNWYNGGATLSSQYSGYIASPNTACNNFAIFKKGDTAWTNYANEKTINWVVAHCDFDILCLQEYGNNSQTDATITTAFTNIADFFFTNYVKPIRIVSLCDAAARGDLATVTARIEHYNEVFMESCCSQGIIPAGLAVTYACDDPGLDALGDDGHLSPDGVHAQEGLPCLLQSYVVAMWIFDLLGMDLSVLGSKVRITTDIYNAMNIPGPNLGTGVIEGTDANHLAAQKAAIKAYKRGLYLVNTAVANLT